MKTLLVEDDRATRRLIEHVLTQRGHQVTSCEDAETAWDIYCREGHPLVLLDWLLPGMDGLELCRRMRASPHGAGSVIIVTTARDQPADLVEVLDAGADDYLTKPLDIRLLAVRLAIAERHLDHLLERARAEAQVTDLRRLLDEKARLEDLIGKSPPMTQVFRLIRDLAPVDTTVLIEGETGTGKELAARAIHSLSRRQSKRFVAVNCAGLTESLIASQLFGHKRGAFTGASDDHVGFFETAHGGTIFLDEIGDVPLPVQTSLLRVLQEREILRVGDSLPRKIDVRVIAATHRHLADEVKQGGFRADLLYRIRVARILLPPLRDRRADIPMLISHFLSLSSSSSGKRMDGVTIEAIRLLTAYDWPGNVRELQSAVEFGVVRSRGAVLAPTDLPPEIISPAAAANLSLGDSGDALLSAMRSVGVITRDDLVRVLHQARGNRTRAAKLLGVSRATFYRRLGELALDPADPDLSS